MRVLVLSWEYPPQIVGGLGRHVDRLTAALAAEGHEVHVLTRAAEGEPDTGTYGRVHVHRVPEYPPQFPFDDLIPWVLQFNLGMLEAGIKLLHKRRFDVIHAHDWLVAYAAGGLRDLFGVPVVSTVHATEYGRHQGWLPGDMNKLIHQIEWWLTYVSRRVITCSTYMRDSVEKLFELPAAKLDVVPNGVAVRMGDAGETRADGADAAPTVLFAGRLEYEKGVQTLIAAAPKIIANVPDVRFEIAGTGTYADELHALIADSGLHERFTFRGFVDEDAMPEVYRSASVVVAPSIYEPFGIVALEAMAARVPVIVGDTGGLRELVAHEENGLRIEPENADDLASAVCRVLTDPEFAADLVAGGSRMSAAHSWRVIARRSVEVFERAIAEEAELDCETAPEGLRPPLRLVWDASATYRATIEGADA